MGFFSGEDVITIAVSATPLVDMAEVTSILTQAVSSAVLKNQDIPSNLQQAYITNFASRVKRFYRYGRDHYIRGLPTAVTSSLYLSPADLVAVEAMAEDLSGDTVVINRAFVAEYLDATFYAYKLLYDIYDYPNAPILINTYEYALATMNWNGTTREIAITLTPVSTLGDLEDIIITVPIPIAEPYYHVIYTTDTDSRTHYYAYQISSNEYPDLVLTDPVPYDDKFYPIPLIRTNFINVNKDKESELYLSTKKLLKYISMDVNVLVDGILESPSIGDIDDVFLIFALNTDTEIPESKEYLYKFFKSLYYKSSITKTIYDLYKNDDDIAPENFLELTEGAGGYKVKHVWNYIESSIIDGSVGIVGYTKKTVVKLGKQTIIPDEDIGYYKSATYYNSTLTLEHQINDTQYERIHIVGLRTVFSLHTGDGIMSDIQEVGDPRSLIPIQVDLLSTFNGREEEQILLNAIHILVFAQHEEHLSWYETGAFTIVLIIIAVVLYIFVPQFAAIIDKMLAHIASFSTMTATEVITSLFKTIIVNYAIQHLSQEVGGVLGAVISVVALSVLPTNFGGLGYSLKGLPWAETLLRATASTASNYAIETQNDLAKLNEDFTNFLKEAEDKDKELDDMIAVFSNPVGNAFDPLETLGLAFYTNEYESPDEFLHRTLNTNPGIATLDSITNYTNNALQLPRLHDTLIA